MNSLLCVGVRDSNLISCCIFQVCLILLLFNQLRACHNWKETLFLEVLVWHCAAGLSMDLVPLGQPLNWGKGKPFLSLAIPKSSYCQILNGRFGLQSVCFELSPGRLADGCDRNTHRLRSVTQHPCIKFSKNVLFSNKSNLGEDHHGSLSPHPGAEWWCHT